MAAHVALDVLREYVAQVGKFCVDADYREIVLLRLFSARNLHQTSVVTRMDRYPGVFSLCRQYFEGRTDVRILSFGCATGEEVLTIRGYFPSAFILGAEVNRRSLARCRTLKVDDRIAFTYSDHDRIVQQGPFDAVFCMAVLQRGPHSVERQQVPNIRLIYPFEKFDDQVTRLDSVLRKNGLLVISHSQYDLGDASVGGKYEPLDLGPHNRSARFDRNGDRKPLASRSASVFVKARD